MRERARIGRYRAMWLKLSEWLDVNKLATGYGVKSECGRLNVSRLLLSVSL